MWALLSLYTLCCFLLLPLHTLCRDFYCVLLPLLLIRRNGVRFAAKMEATSVDPSVTVEEEAEELRSAPESKVDVSQHLAVLKTAAKTRKVPPTELLVAINAIDNAKVDPSDFLQRIGGTTESPGRTWMLIFTADKKLVSISTSKPHQNWAFKQFSLLVQLEAQSPWNALVLETFFFLADNLKTLTTPHEFHRSRMHGMEVLVEASTFLSQLFRALMRWWVFAWCIKDIFFLFFQLQTCEQLLVLYCWIRMCILHAYMCLVL